VRPLLPGLLACLVLAAAASADNTASEACNDYPTTARADYVLACVNVNGGTQEALQRCSCSIDVIASILPYDRYQAAETVLRMRQLGGGYLAQEFRQQESNEILSSLREAQAEAEVRCF
jgi:hypothetical protein